jgi:hypothetical protein
VVVIAGAARTSGRSVEDLRRRLDQVGAALIGGVFIDMGKAGRHRQRSAGPQLAGRPPVAGPDRRALGQAAAPVRRPPTATRPMPAIPDDAASRAAGGPVQRPM